MTVRRWAGQAVAAAAGREHRSDPVLPVTGGPAGNARLTAWVGIFLLVGFLVEVGTLLNVTALLSWHVVVGVLLIPPALVKTGSTGWRFAGYYTRRTPYRAAGPPPMLLRILGPFVVLSTMAVLGTGLALIALGPQAGRASLLTVLGNRISALTLHQGSFLAWAVITGVHTAGRLLPALHILTASQRPRAHIPGRRARAALLAGTLLISGIAAAVLLGPADKWHTIGPRPPHPHALQHDANPVGHIGDPGNRPARDGGSGNSISARALSPRW